jgi:hypothetical protein
MGYPSPNIVWGSEMSWISNRFMQLAVLAALCGMTMGVIMGATKHFELTAAHAHLNLLGWVSMMIYGLFYRTYPTAARGWLATTHFWVAVTGVVVTIPSLALMLTGNHPKAEIGVSIGSILVLTSMVLFAAIVIGATRAKPAEATRAAA